MARGGFKGLKGLKGNKMLNVENVTIFVLVIILCVLIYKIINDDDDDEDSFIGFSRPARTKDHFEDSGSIIESAIQKIKGQRERPGDSVRTTSSHEVSGYNPGSIVHSSAGETFTGKKCKWKDVSGKMKWVCEN